MNSIIGIIQKSYLCNPDNDPSFQFNFDETIYFEKFCTYVGIVDAFYKSSVSLKFTFQLLGVMRIHFTKHLSLQTRLQMQNLLDRLDKYSYFSKNM